LGLLALSLGLAARGFFFVRLPKRITTENTEDTEGTQREEGRETGEREGVL
jgi:hypothetical protein